MFSVPLAWLFFVHFTSSNIQSNYKLENVDHFRKIMQVFNAESDISRGTVICDNDTTFCTQICDIMQRIPIPVMIFSSANRHTKLFSKLNILHFQSDDEILFLIKNQTLNWSLHSYYIIFFNTPNVTKILSALWTDFKIRRAILFRNTTTLAGILYDVSSNDVKMINIENTTVRDLFQMKNFRGIRLRVTLFQRLPEVINTGEKFLGVNYKMMELLSKKLNFIPVIQDSTDGKKFGDFVNGVYTGGLGDIVYGRSDVAFNGYFLRKTNNNEYTYLFPVSLDYVCLVAPKAGKIPKYMVPFMCFPENVWLALVLSFISVSACRYFMFYMRKHWFNLKENSNIFLSLFSVTINLPISFNQYEYLSSRIILIIFLSQMYVIVTSFQGSLVTLLSIPKYYEDMDTLAELNCSALDIKTSSPTIIQFFKQDSTLKTLVKKIKSFKESDFRNFNFTFFARIIYNRRDLFHNFFIKKENRRFLVHRLKECPMLYYTSYVVSWNFPFVEEFNSIIMRVVESGMPLTWDREIVYTMIKEYEPQVKLNPSDDQLENRTFTLNDLEVAFMVLVFGYGCSIGVFIWEIVNAKKK